MCMRFEAKHQEIKAYTNVSFNRKNICFSVGNKFAFKYSDFLMNSEDITYPSFEDFKRWNQHPSEQVMTTIKIIHKGAIFPGKKVTFKGTDYSVGDYIATENGAIIITNFLKTSDNKILIVYKQVKYMYIQLVVVSLYLLAFSGKNHIQ